MATAIGAYVTLADLKTRTANTTVDAARDVILTQIVDETNQWIESYTGRVLAPISSDTYYFDGYGLSSLYRLDFGRIGARTITAFDVGSDGVTFGTAIASTAYVLRPLTQDRALAGEPASYLEMRPGNALPYGYANIRITMTAGFTAVPDDVRAVALGIATRAWHGRQSGMADIVGSTETGAPIVTRIVAPEFKIALDRYRPVMVA